MAGAGTTLRQARSRDAAPTGAGHDVRVVGPDERLEGFRLIGGEQNQRVPALQCREVGDKGVDVIGCGEGNQAPHRAEPRSECVDAGGQVPIRQGQAVGEDGGAVSTVRQVREEGGPHELWLRGHLSIVIAKPYLSKSLDPRAAPANSLRAALYGRPGLRYGDTMSTPYARYDAADKKLSSVISRVANWSAPSPCEGWTAFDVVQHLITTQRDFLKTHNLIDTPRPDTEADPAGAWQTHTATVRAVLENPEAANMTFDGFFGHTTVGETLDRFYVFDMLVHRWDIAKTMAGDEHFTDSELDAIEASVDGFGEHLYMEGICKPALDVPESAGREAKILGRMGRDAGWNPAAAA